MEITKEAAFLTKFKSDFQTGTFSSGGISTGIPPAIYMNILRTKSVISFS